MYQFKHAAGSDLPHSPLFTPTNTAELKPDPTRRKAHTAQQPNSVTTLEQLRKKLTGHLPDTIIQLQHLWAKLSYFNWHTPAFHLFYSIISKVAAQSERLGLVHLQDQSNTLQRHLRHYIENDTVPDTAERELINTMLEGLGRSIQLTLKGEDAQPHQRAPDSPTLATKQHGLIYILDSDVKATRALCAELTALGHQVSYFRHPEALMHELRCAQPSLLLVDVNLAEGCETGLNVIAQIKENPATRCPIFVTSTRGDMSLRLAAVRLGCDEFFTKPISLDFLIDKVESLFQPASPTQLSVLIWGGAASADAALVCRLTQLGISAQYELNPLKFLESLTKTAPDLLILDTTEPALDPWLVTHALRHEETFRTLPIVLIEPSAAGEALDRAAPNKLISQAPTCPDAHERHDPQVIARLAKCDAQDQILATVSRVIHHAHSVKQHINALQRADSVSGFLNRRHTLGALASSLATATETHPNTLFLLRLDHPDILRKKAGLSWDDAIHQVASLLRANLPPEATVGRLEETTFAIVWPLWDRAKLTECAKNLIGALRTQPINLPHHSIHISASIAITVITPDLHDVTTLVTVAEQLALQALQQGGNSVIEHPDNQSVCGRVPQRLALGAVYEALEQKLFHLVYQPILKTTDTSEEMYEALLRLHDVNNKLITPQQFLPIVAQNHLYPEVDRWVIEHAVDQLCHDMHAKMSASLFLKVSGESLGKKALLAWISNLKNSAGLRGHNRLVFELSEPDIYGHLQQSECFLKALPSLDCGFAVDHFGSTDYSLVLLDHLKVDYVKLHGPLVQSLLTNQVNRLKVKSLIDKARKNDIQVIASSIESTKTMALLWGWGISHFQGYFIQQPHSVFDFDFRGIEL